jgi:hypothetical protein
MPIANEIENRVAEIKDQTSNFSTGSLTYFVHETNQNSSPTSFTKAVLKTAVNPVPFSQAKFRADEERILYASIPLKSSIIPNLNLAIPWSHAGLYPIEGPMQLSSEARIRTPCTFVLTRKGTFSSLGEEDPLTIILRKDEKLKRLIQEALVWKHICRGNISMDLEWTLQVVPLTNSSLCILNTGSIWKGFLTTHRVYNFENRIMLLEQLIKGVSEVVYSGVSKETEIIPPIYELFRRSLSA